MGWSTISTASNSATHAFFYNFYGDQTMHDLGTLGGRPQHRAGINSAGQIVGDSNLTRRNGLPRLHLHQQRRHDGPQLADSVVSGWTWTEANAINDSGWIVGYGVNSTGHTDAFLLQPSTVVQNPGDANGATPGTIFDMLSRSSLNQVRGWKVTLGVTEGIPFRCSHWT